MAIEDSTTSTESKPQREEEEEYKSIENYLNSISSDEEEEEETVPVPHDLSFSSSDSEYDSEFESEDDVDSVPYTRPGGAPAGEKDDNSAEANVRAFMKFLNSKWMKRKEEEEENKKEVEPEELFDFPKDEEGWTEKDLKEMWADAPLKMTKPGWDPVFADEEDWAVMREEVKDGRDPPIAPFYLPYRKPYPVIPDNHYDISNPKAVVEELDRIEEFLKWVSYVFPDGSSYEGTVWDDLAHGRGVLVGDSGLVRYEGEWLQNNMDGHGVIEVDIPDDEPVPGSKLEAKMRAEGRIISRDFMSPEDREWLEMDIEDSIRLAGGMNVTPFYESEEWIKQFGEKPEKGRYRYAGQWKEGRMHGCGVYEVNERLTYGRFYFGELLEDEHGCDDKISGMHAGIAEVAAAKAQMFVNKPDGMVREERGPYGDPQHPYFYEEEDVWMAPGFINQFYEVPDYWKNYVQEVDQEREMWLNSFYKAPLRLPMPSELEYLWSKEEYPEFVLINKEPEPDPEDSSKLIYTTDPLILHTPTGRLINYIEDEKYGLRLFWQPPLKEGEDVDPTKVEFLPLGFDEFYGLGETVEKDNIWKRLIVAVGNACKPVLDNIDNWVEEQKKGCEMRMKLIEKELELLEAEICLEETMEDLEEELKMKEEEEEEEEEEEDKVGLDSQEKEVISTAVLADQDEKTMVRGDGEEEEDEEEDDDDVAPSSFGSASEEIDLKKTDQKGKPGKSPFAASSLSFDSCNLVLTVPSKLRQSFLSWREGKLLRKAPSSHIQNPVGCMETFGSISYPLALGQNGILRAAKQPHNKFRTRNPRTTQLHSLSRLLSGSLVPAEPKTSLKGCSSQSHSCTHIASERGLDDILSLHIPMYNLETYMDMTMQSAVV